jgi:hypothetical protein
MINLAVILAFNSGTIFGYLITITPNKDPWWPALIPLVTGLVCGLLLANSANAQGSLQPQWDTHAQHERATTARSANPEYSNCCSNGECWFERGNVCHSDRALRGELRQCMVDLTTNTDPDLRHWCEAQSGRLP